MKQPINAYHGVVVPMVTPLTAGRKIDKTSAVKIIKFLQDNQTIPFILGTTGEADSIPVPEKETLIKILADHKKEGQPAISGVTGLTLTETIKLANKYIKIGIDTVVITLPSNYQLTDFQIKNYYNSLSKNIDGNIIMYNIPKTVHQSIPVSIIDELSHNKNIIGIKDSENNEERLVHSLSLWRDRSDFFHFVGVNPLMFKGLLLGSKGIVPSSANFIPHLYVKFYKHCVEGKTAQAERIFRQTLKWSKLYQDGKTMGDSLATLKIIMSEMRLCSPHVMMPVTKLDNKEIARIVTQVKEKLLKL